MKNFFISFLFLFLGCGGTGTPSTPVPEPTNPEIVSFITLMNNHRVSVGCPALIWHPTLAGVAQDHSEDMDENNYLGHTNLQGKDPFDRMKDNQIEYSSAGENIALNGGGAEAVLDSWLGSAGHRANIENCSYTHHGVGLSGSFWTHMFMVPF